MDNPQLRSGLPADVQAMYELDLLCFSEQFRFDLRAMRRYVEQPEAIVLIAEARDTLAGFIIVSRNRRTRTAYLITLDVHPAARRKGIARTLIYEAEYLAMVAGVLSIYLHVHIDNDAAIHFYESLGYTRQSHHLDFYASGLHAWTYVKELDSNSATI